MGVPFFFAWLKKKYDNIALNLSRPQVAQHYATQRAVSLGLDLNGIIHTEAAKVYLYGEHATDKPLLLKKYLDSTLQELQLQHFRAIGNSILDKVKLVQPAFTLIIAIDGPTGIPKAYQQKQRRFKAKSLFQSQEPSASSSASKSKAPAPEALIQNGYITYHTTGYQEKSRFDSNCITPGTQFMVELDSYLLQWIEDNRAHLPSQVIYSSHQGPGEGEHKIAHYLRTLKFPASYSSYYHVVYGLDADLIMLGLLSPQVHYQLLRDDVGPASFNGQSALKQEFFHILDIESCREAIRGEIGSIEDYVLLTFWIGNDFLPAFQSVSIKGASNLKHKASTDSQALIGMDALLEAYIQAGRRLITVESNRINWEALYNFMLALQKIEPELLEMQAKEQKEQQRIARLALARGSYHKSRGYPSIPLNEAYRSKKVEAPNTQLDKSCDFFDLAYFTNSYYQRALGAKDSPMRREELAGDWLGGLAWIYKYYVGGMEAVNVEWSYNHNYVPLTYDILSLLDKVVFEAGDTLFEWNAIDRRGRPFTPLEQLISVLPPTSAGLVPAGLRMLILSPDSPLADLYPLEFLADTSGKSKEHESVALLPFIDISRVRDALNEVQLSEEERKRNRFTEDEVFNRYVLPSQEEKRVYAQGHYDRY